ncbi:MAG: hypothetical protein A3I05_05870 [Deltaproteobacteria bacterium RIFCSPLOWO2_02_FULL_44_10]|nr:MAG: hypothetical protein A3C46_04695 [Deltaproteobacteria bacterium RIFCSPHIGHO2_02_FULL_44_16]OGQ46135.1 MAG: hypothetical protein A3I05_05870 [Deltaproteobacteria bacterium RIFCSPLOWO2_02_FULL_44_10]
MFRVKQVRDVSVIDTEGELSRNNMHIFENILEHLSQSDCRNVVLNLGKLRHLDYRLVQRIVDRVIQFQCDGGDLKMANASMYIRQILQAMGVEEEMYGTVEEALLSFLQGEPSGELQ